MTSLGIKQRVRILCILLLTIFFTMHDDPHLCGYTNPQGMCQVGCRAVAKLKNCPPCLTLATNPLVITALF